jgi:hypothetical protein
MKVITTNVCGTDMFMVYILGLHMAVVCHGGKPGNTKLTYAFKVHGHYTQQNLRLSAASGS